MTWEPTVGNCDDYLAERTGKYEYRAIRYRATADAMFRNGLTDADTVFDIGAGWTEFDYCLRKEYDWRGRYIPIDGGIDGTDLEVWTPPRHAEWFVALEIAEHLSNVTMFLTKMQMYATNGVIVSTPDPVTTDVLGMDPTHKTPIYREYLETLNFKVQNKYFYGGVFSQGQTDSLFGIWLRENN